MLLAHRVSLSAKSRSSGPPGGSALKGAKRETYNAFGSDCGAGDTKGPALLDMHSRGARKSNVVAHYRRAQVAKR